MATSRTEIANRALDAIGADPIGSINDTTKAAGLCNRLMSPLLDDMLRQHPWNFAKARASLPALSDVPAWGFAYQYQLPGDFLRMIALNVSDPTTPYKIEAGRVLTDVGAPLGILYTQRITNDVSRLDPVFTTALVYALARDLAQPIAGSSTLREVMQGEYMRALRDARSANAAEGTPDSLWSETLLIARMV